MLMEKEMLDALNIIRKIERDVGLNDVMNKIKETLEYRLATLLSVPLEDD